LRELLEPILLEEFLKQYFGEYPLHIPGRSRRFEQLLTWDFINNLLAFPLEGLDVYLTYQGRRLDREEYSRRAKGLFGTFTQIDVARLTSNLRSGALLSVRNIEAYSLGVSQLCETIQREFGGYVHAAMFAGWHRTQGFNTHWDAYDSLVLQIAGTKHWRIFETSMKYPVDVPKEETQFTSSAKPRWEGEISSGDLLYIPRGWWHDARPTDAQSLHLTLGCEVPTGVSVANHAFTRLRDKEEARKAVPSRTLAEERKVYVDAISELIGDSFRSSAAAPTTLQSGSGPVHARPSLPWAALLEVEDAVLPPSTMLTWLPQQFVGDASAADVALQGLECNQTELCAARNIVTMLSDRRHIAMACLRAQFSHFNLDRLIMKLAAQGLIAIIDSD